MFKSLLKLTRHIIQVPAKDDVLGQFHADGIVPCIRHGIAVLVEDAKRDHQNRVAWFGCCGLFFHFFVVL